MKSSTFADFYFPINVEVQIPPTQIIFKLSRDVVYKRKTVNRSHAFLFVFKACQMNMTNNEREMSKKRRVDTRQSRFCMQAQHTLTENDYETIVLVCVFYLSHFATSDCFNHSCKPRASFAYKYENRRCEQKQRYKCHSPKHCLIV